MDCRRFAALTEEAEQAAKRARQYVEAGDSKNASLQLDALERAAAKAREELGKVGA